MSSIRFFTELTRRDVGIAGGKGASLGEMTETGIPVPPGYVILSMAFDEFLHTSDLIQDIESQLNMVNYNDIASVDRASRVIHGLIEHATMPSAIEHEILEAFGRLNVEYVAVRSSATAEDSSVASWAGELESYLNTTEEQLLRNVKKCWASLFTPRAIVYRREKDLHTTHVSVAVVVQAMVQSEVAGITFTVHPVTKDRNQMIIEACWGLGEFIVGGVVTPDSYVIDKRDSSVIDINISSQEKMLKCGSQGNETIDVPVEKRERQKLTQDQLTELGAICLNIEKHYGFPCDIEWGMENEKFFIVQSRPITTLS